MVNQKSSFRSWIFWLQWILACAIGGAVAEVIAGMVGETVVRAEAEVGEGTVSQVDILIYLVRFLQVDRGVVFGPVLGTMQWFVLRRWGSRAGWWLLATIWGGLTWPIGWVVGIIVTVLMAGATDRPVADDIGSLAIGLTVGGAAFGLMIGIVQWSVLRRWASRAGWWVLVSALGWGVSWGVVITWGLSRVLREDVHPPDLLETLGFSLLGGLTLGVTRISGTMAGVIFGAGLGLVLGIITGLPLAWLLHRSFSEGQSSPSMPAAHLTTTEAEIRERSS